MYEISQFSFEKICKILKSRRIADDLRVHNSRVENLNEENPNEILAVSDPAENDKDLQAILEDNKKIFDQKYTEVKDKKVTDRKIKNNYYLSLSVLMPRNKRKMKI